MSRIEKNKIISKKNLLFKNESLFAQKPNCEKKSTFALKRNEQKQTQICQSDTRVRFVLYAEVGLHIISLEKKKAHIELNL